MPGNKRFIARSSESQFDVLRILKTWKHQREGGRNGDQEHKPGIFDLCLYPLSFVNVSPMRDAARSVRRAPRRKHHPVAED